MQPCISAGTPNSASTAMVIVLAALLYLAVGPAEGGAYYAYNSTTRYSFTASREDTTIADIAARSRGYRDPHGVKVHASMKTVRWVNAGRTSCRFGRGCETTAVCGTKCEPILLRVTIPCQSNKNGWCPSARKFLRCYPVLCLNNNYSGRAVSRSRVDPDNFVILRWKRPAPKYELDARRNRQTSTQSAIFRS